MLTVTYSGFVNNEDTNVLSGSPDVSTAADINSPVGTYPIVVSQGNLSTNGNYSFNFTNGMLTLVPAGTLFFDDFTRGTDPGPLSPWIVQSGIWTVTGGVLNGGPNALQNFEFVYVPNNWTDYSVQGQVKFSTTNAWGGGIGGRLDPTTGAHYAAWVYPEGSPGGSNVLNLVKYDDWNSWRLMQQVSLPGVGTNWHSVKLVFQGSQITVYYDTNQVLSVTDDGSFDGQGAYTNGGISVDMWTEYVTYIMSVDNVIVYPIVKTDQTITFDPLSTRTYGEAPFALSAMASSGLPVTFSIVSGPATNAGDTITLTGAGTVTVRASQAGNNNFNPAPDVDRSFTVNPAAIAVTADVKSKVYGDADPALTYHLTGGSLVSGDSFTGGLTRVAGENVGAHAILQGTLTAGANYNLTYTGANLTITPANSANVLISSENPSPQGSNVTFTATLTPVSPATTTPTGNVQFFTNGVALGGPVALGGGVASITTAQLPPGSNTVTAVYAGSTNFQGSTNSLVQVVTLYLQTPSTLGAKNNGNGTVTITFAGTPGGRYVVQATAILAPVEWTNVSTNTAATDGQWTFTDSMTTHSQRFYRSAKP